MDLDHGTTAQRRNGATAQHNLDQHDDNQTSITESA
jgi:hypothetical protein